MRDFMLGFVTNYDSAPRNMDHRVDRALGKQIDPTNPSITSEHVTSSPYHAETLEKAIETSHREFFNKLADEWLQSTQAFSSTTLMMRRREFSELSAMGTRALKFTLERMAKGEVRIQWFPLLKTIAKVDPVPPEKRGIVKEMAAAWIDWGRAENHIIA